MKRFLSALVVLAAAMAVPSTCYGRHGGGGGHLFPWSGRPYYGLYRPSTADYTYLANVYPRAWRAVKLSTPLKYHYPGLTDKPDGGLSEYPTSGLYHGLRRTGY